MVDATKLQAANIAKSLRATVPMSVVKQMKLEQGDMIEWELDKVDNKWIVIVRKQ